MKRSRVGPMLLAALVATAAWPAGSGEAGDLLYRIEGERVVFTNVPGGGARPVPGFTPPQRRPAAALPATVYDGAIERVAHETGLSPELIKAVALVESGFDPRAVSPKGAQGLMQLMPETARQYGVADAFDPHDNLRAGAQHLRSLLDQFDGDVKLALAAYNAGAGAVRRHGGVPAFRETRDYVGKVQDHLRPAQRTRRPDPPPGEVRLTRGPDGTVLLAN